MSESNSLSGVGVFGLLGITLVVLKLCDVIDWSWWWVTAPFWGSVCLGVLVFLIGLIFITLNERRKC